METPKIALAPNLRLLLVPSKSIIIWSTLAWLKGSTPFKATAILLFTLPIAFSTPLPDNRLPPSRNSTASFSPVEAPEGTAARPMIPLDSVTSTSTVGFPRESKISRALTFSITSVITKFPLLNKKDAYYPQEFPRNNRRHQINV